MVQYDLKTSTLRDIKVVMKKVDYGWKEKDLYKAKTGMA